MNEYYFYFFNKSNFTLRKFLKLFFFLETPIFLLLYTFILNFSRKGEEVKIDRVYSRVLPTHSLRTQREQRQSNKGIRNNYVN